MAKLCLALDTEYERALELIKALRGYPLVIKVGYKLFISQHRKITDRVKEEGFELFLDIKLHDIPNTVKDGVLSAQELGADYLTLHISAGRQALREAVKVKGSTKLLGVSLLTSLDEEDLRDIGYCGNRLVRVVSLSKIAIEEGLDGVVCSGLELGVLRENFGGSFIAVVPGVRLEGEQADDQKKAVSLEQALRAGADLVVMGRSILRSKDPIKTVEDILKLF